MKALEQSERNVGRMVGENERADVGGKVAAGYRGMGSWGGSLEGDDDDFAFASPPPSWSAGTLLSRGRRWGRRKVLRAGKPSDMMRSFLLLPESEASAS